MEKKTKIKSKKIIEPIKVRVELTDETFDFVEFVQMVLNFRKNKEREKNNKKIYFL